MHGNAIGTMLLGNQSGRNRIRVERSSRLPQGCDMVYIYT
jgi:hypothetical protein